MPERAISRARRSLLRLLAAALVGCAALAVLPGSAAAAPMFGFNDEWTGRLGWIEQSRHVGASAARVYVSWSDIEPRRGVLLFGGIDGAYRRMLAAGVRPVLDVVGAPPWARSPRASCLGGGSCVHPPHPRHDGAWRQFLRAVATRYPRALAIEVWNEQNLAHFFAPRADPVRYTSLLRQARRAVKAVAPQIAVVSGGLAGTGSPPRGGMADGAFLRAMYRAGARGAMDAVGVHPYPASHPLVNDMRATIGRVRAARNAARDRRRPIWVTEVGLSTASSNLGGHEPVSESEQAAGLAAMYCELRRQSDVRVALLFRWADTGVGSWDAMLGIHRADGSPKPARAALAAVLANPACPQPSLRITASPGRPAPGDTITYRVSGYSGPGVYRWDLDGNGTFERYTGRVPVATTSFRRRGRRRATVQAVDGLELYQARTVVRLAANRPPVPVLDVRPGRTVAPGTLVTLSGARSFDRERAGRVRNWQWDIVKATGRSHHYSGRRIQYRYPRPGRYRVRLTVTDNLGRKASRVTVVLVVRGLPTL
jgi:polysaccharide biosynthesis protein PslG